MAGCIRRARVLLLSKYRCSSSFLVKASPRVALLALALTLTFFPVSGVFAAVSDITVTDVTTRALSVVWVSDEPIITATIRIYSDINGVSELTPGLNVTTDSVVVANAHVQGIAKVTVFGLVADTDYYIQTETVGSTGLVTLPVFSSLTLARTALETNKVNASSLPIVNDVLVHDVFFPDGVTPAPGTLIIANAEGLSAYPLSSFVGEDGFAPQTAAIDTNNFFGADGRSLELSTDDALKITVFRGLLCSTEFANQKYIEHRRTPVHEETPVITEVELTPKCYISDPFCDNTVNVLDVQFVLNSFGNNLGACAYNPGVDVISDGQINVLDVQRVLNDFGDTVPSQN